MGMTKIRTLPLAVRLAGAFGALTVALVIVAFTGVHAMKALSGESSDLADHNLRAAQLLAGEQERAKDNVGLVEQHLYVHDGDLPTEDRLAKEIAANDAESSRDSAELKKLLAGTSVADEYTQYDQLHTQMTDAQNTAVQRSRGETIRNADNRDGSRNYFESTVLKLDGQLGQAGDALMAAANKE